jgi:predicted O-methyltransferase YrrM
MSSMRHLHACLVHERPDCVLDLVRNLHHLDPEATILLYDGGRDPGLLRGAASWERYGAVVHPSPRPMQWGRLHDFALDCMRFALEHLPFDAMTIVDSDQLGARAGFAARIAEAVAARPAVGLLGSAGPLEPGQRLAAPAEHALRETELWRPYLRRFPSGEAKFPHWTFWPSTVFTADGARALVAEWDRDGTLPELLARSQMWATEEVLLPTLVALLGFEIARTPCCNSWVRYRARYTSAQIEAALAHPDAYWIHPVPRRWDDPLRVRIRRRLGEYGAPVDAEARAGEDGGDVLAPAILEEVRSIEGWLADDEARLLAAATSEVASRFPPSHALVEVGSYCGKATVLMARVLQRQAADAPIHAIDPHDGRVGALGHRVHETGPTRHKLERNLARAGLEHRVRIVESRAPEVAWNGPIGLLFLDGLHDYESTARDFAHLQPHVVGGGYVLFHDDADYYPGVRLVVQEAVRSGAYRLVRRAGTMAMLQKSAAGGTAAGPRAAGGGVG